MTTTNKKTLDSIYKKYDAEFDEEEQFSEWLRYSFSVISAMPELAGSNIGKPHIIYSLVLALSAARSGLPGVALEGAPLIVGVAEAARLEARLLDMSAALDIEEEELGNSEHRAFVLASIARTNVRAQRMTRLESFLKAIRDSVAPEAA